MDENTKIEKTPAPSADAAPMPSVDSNYASFWQRFGAALVDGILLSTVLGALFGAKSYSGGAVSVGYSGGGPALLGAVYYVVMISVYGATLGKMALKIKVQNVDTGNKPTYIEAILREVVGKFVSALVLLIGYFWMLWDPNKQTWHDKIAKTVVVKA